MKNQGNSRVSLMKINLNNELLIFNVPIFSIAGLYFYKHSALNARLLFFIIPVLSITFAFFKLRSVLLKNNRAWLTGLYIVIVLFLHKLSISFFPVTNLRCFL